MKPLWEIADFFRSVQRQMRFGQLSRVPLQLLRLEWEREFLECEWMARPADPWDADIHDSIRKRNATEQALSDAVDVSRLVFSALPSVQAAVLRTFRQSEPPELILLGYVSREQTAISRASSLAMRAKLLGFQFHLEDGVLRPLQNEELSLESAI
jgi:hypothetical protein